ncbi:hypothetical protein HJC23_007752 [Cyclotella cryptica]|uniref:Condensin complex subunit 2 n=1 Tax=Cyclotella cryptica TaxID=29204 RepID=A0ABD3R2S4_9STRA
MEKDTPPLMEAEDSRSCSWLSSPCWGAFADGDATFVSDGGEGVEVEILSASVRALNVSEGCCEGGSSYFDVEGFKTPPRSHARARSTSIPCNAKSPASAKKKLTRAEAFNKGMLLHYLFCNGGFTDEDEDDYEASWAGHQPLTPETWTVAPSKSNIPPRLSASEQRLMRRRRRRGLVMSPLKSHGSIVAGGFLDAPSPPAVLTKTGPRARQEDETSFASSSKASNAAEYVSGMEWSVPYPKDLVDPHLGDEWKTRLSTGLSGPELE